MLVAGETTQVPCSNRVTGRFVVITIPGREEVLSLCEVQVFGEKGPHLATFHTQNVSF